MKTMYSLPSSKTRAADALKSVLHQVSGIRVKEIHFNTSELDSRIDMLASVEIYGRRHALACKVVAADDLHPDSNALGEFCEHAAKVCANATPVVIAPRLSEETRLLCRELRTCFLDLDGNARLEIGEFFIARQHLPVREPKPLRMPVAPALERTPIRKLTPVRADILLPDRGVAVATA